MNIKTTETGRPAHIYALWHFQYGPEGESRTHLFASLSGNALISEFNDLKNIATTPLILNAEEHKQAKQDERCHYFVGEVKTV